MSEPLLSIVEGTTKPIKFTLLIQESTDTAPQPLDLTGFTGIQIVVKRSNFSLVLDSSSGVSVTGTTSGQVEFAPSSSGGDFFQSQHTPYRVRFRVTDALGDKDYWPNDEERLIEVNPV